MKEEGVSELDGKTIEELKALVNGTPFQVGRMAALQRKGEEPAPDSFFVSDLAGIVAEFEDERQACEFALLKGPAIAKQKDEERARMMESQIAPFIPLATKLFKDLVGGGVIFCIQLGSFKFQLIKGPKA